MGASAFHYYYSNPSGEPGMDEKFLLLWLAFDCPNLHLSPSVWVFFRYPGPVKKHGAIVGMCRTVRRLEHPLIGEINEIASPRNQKEQKILNLYLNLTLG